MKKIFTLIAVAAMAISANAQGIGWAFDTTPDAAPVITDDNFSGGSVTVTGQDASYPNDGKENYPQNVGYRVQKPSAGDNSGIPFVTFQPLDVDEGVTVTWTANVADGKSVTPNRINMNMARFGTDGGTITVSYAIDGGEPVVLDEGLIPARNNKSQADDAKGEEEKYTAAYSARLRGIGAASKSFAVTAKFTGLGVTKQIGYALISIQTGDQTPSTGISTIKAAEKNNGAIYNLAGQKVAEGYKGIAIMNGKKVVLK